MLNNVNLDEISCNTEELIGSMESVEEAIKEVCDETATDNLSPITEEVEVIESEVFTEKADDDFEDSSIEEKKQISPNPSTLFDFIGHPTRVTPTRKSLSKNDIVKTPAISISSKKAPATWSSRKVNNSQLNERKESETAVMIDLMVDEVVNVTPKEVLPVDVFESTMTAAMYEKREEKEDDVGFDNVKPESDDTAFESVIDMRSRIV
ncbi:hypothetical protein L1887_31873 [Cichorium endivia]|nr:hypothetical protein L1887_31873 [Cichorium endivia]